MRLYQIGAKSDLVGCPRIDERRMLRENIRDDSNDEARRDRFLFLRAVLVLGGFYNPSGNVMGLRSSK